VTGAAVIAVLAWFDHPASVLVVFGVEGEIMASSATAIRACVVGLILSVGPAPNVAGEVAPEPAINVSEQCTICKDVFRCTAEPGAPQSTPHPLVVYYLHPYTTWEQIVTIWEYLIRFGKPKLEDTRELTVYEFSQIDEPPTRVTRGLAAELDAVEMVVRLPDAAIDRKSGAWLVPVKRAGTCRLLPPADGMAFLRKNPPAA